jgi:hypothetical protein
MNLRAIDRDHADAHQPGIRAHPQHLPEQLTQRALVADTEARDRGVIWHLVGRDHPERDVLAAPSLDPPRRALADRVRIHDQRHHHRRIVRRPAVPIGAIGGKERGQIELGEHLDHKPREVILGQPLAQARRQQQLLLAIARQEVLRHPGILLNRPDDTTFVRQPPWIGAVSPSLLLLTDAGAARPPIASRRAPAARHKRERRPSRPLS